MRAFFVFLLIAFAVALATVVGLRMRWDWPAFTLGLLCGGAASVPASLLSLYLGRQAEGPAPVQRHGYVPLSVMDARMAVPRPQLPVNAGRADTASSMAGERRYRVVGDE